MALFNVFSIAGSGMSAQSLRLNTTASNMSNADNVSGTAEGAYKGRYPIFSAALQHVEGTLNDAAKGVKVDGIYENTTPPTRLYNPGHALADKDGYIYKPNVNMIEEMVDMMSASRSYEMNAQTLNTAKQLMLRTLQSMQG